MAECSRVVITLIAASLACLACLVGWPLAAGWLASFRRPRVDCAGHKGRKWHQLGQPLTLVPPSVAAMVATLRLLHYRCDAVGLAE